MSSDREFRERHLESGECRELVTLPTNPPCYGGPRNSPQRGREREHAGVGPLVGGCARRAHDTEVLLSSERIVRIHCFIFGNNDRRQPIKAVMKGSRRAWNPKRMAHSNADTKEVAHDPQEADPCARTLVGRGVHHSSTRCVQCEHVSCADRSEPRLSNTAVS